MPDVLLSSWLNRVAVANGMAPWSFYLSLSMATGTKRDRCLWIRRGREIEVKKVHWVDAYCNERLASYLAERSGVSAKLIQGLALTRPPGAPVHDRTQNGTLQWVLVEAMPNLLLPDAIEVESMSPRSCIRFCPYCLAEHGDPWFRKFWRTSLASVCIRHGCCLLSGCHCGAEVCPELSKESRSQAFCYTCGDDLRSIKSPPAAHRELNRQREISRRAYEGVEAILAGGGSKRRIISLMSRPTDHLSNLRRTGIIDAYDVNLPITLLLTYNSVRHRAGRKLLPSHRRDDPAGLCRRLSAALAKTQAAVARPAAGATQPPQARNYCDAVRGARGVEVLISARVIDAPY
jgi:hypothetical protein